MQAPHAHRSSAIKDLRPIYFYILRSLSATGSSGAWSTMDFVHFKTSISWSPILPTACWIFAAVKLQTFCWFWLFKTNKKITDYAVVPVVRPSVSVTRRYCVRTAKYKLLGKCYYITFALWHGPPECLSVVCLSSVILLHPTQRVESFGNIFAPSNSLGTQTVCFKNIGAKIRRDYMGLCKLNTRCMKKWRFRPKCRFISKTVQDTALVTIEDE